MDTQNQSTTQREADTTELVNDASPTTETAPPTTENAVLETPPVLATASKKRLYSIVAIIAVGAIIAGGYFFYSTRMADGGPVAVVNGFKIARKEFNENVAVITQAASLQGADVTDPFIQQEINDQALETLVSNTLLIEGAKDAGITVDEAEVQAEYDLLITELGSEEELKRRMEEVGLTEEKLRSNIRERFLVDAFLEAETDIELVSVTEEEAQALYDSYKAGGVAIPPFEEVRAQLDEELLRPKRQEIMNAFLASLKEKAEIEIKI